MPTIIAPKVNMIDPSHKCLQALTNATPINITNRATYHALRIDFILE